MCNFRHTDNSSHSWVWSRAKDSPIKSVLSMDHSTLASNGSFVFLLHSNSWPGPKRLVSAAIPPDQPLCMQLWYFIHGASSLNIYISTNVSETKSWYHTGSTKGKWLFGQMSVKHSSEYKIVLEGANQNQGDFIAVDDVSFLEMECKSTAPSKDNINCAFDVDMCSWKGHKDWKIEKDPFNGPLLHLIGGSQSERQVTSPIFNPQQDGWKCVTFWFTSTLQLFQRSLKLTAIGENGKELLSLWTYNASVQNITYVQVPLPDLDANVRVAFSGKKEQSQPVIAISKVLFLKEECQEIKPIAECHSYQVLDSAERRVNNTIIKSNSDNSLHWYNWYRITGAAGNQIPTSCIKENHCGSRYPIYAEGENPTHKYELKHVDECKTMWQSCCRSRGRLLVRHCGTFYVYGEITIDADDYQAQVCSTYKEVVPVYDKSWEWDSWINTDVDNQWQTVHYNQSSLDGPIETSPDIQELLMTHDMHFDAMQSNGYQYRHKKLSICFWISASNGTFSIFIFDIPSTIRFNMTLFNNTIAINMTNEERAVHVPVFDGQWHHVCVTWTSFWGLWQVFQDGHLLRKGMYFGDGIDFQGNGIMFSSHGPEGSEQNSLVAIISNLNLFGEVLSGEEIVHMSYGCNMNRPGRLLSWNDVLHVANTAFNHAIHPATCLGKSSSSRVLRFKENAGSPTVGTFQSPWFNQSAGSNKECLTFKYKIIGKEPFSLTVLQTTKHPNLTDHRVWLTQEGTANVWNVGRVLITTMSPYMLTFKGQLNGNGHMYVGGLRMTSDKTCTTLPEQATKDACNQNLTSPNGIITTPNYPAPYPAPIACKWTINVPLGHVIRLEVQAFDVGYSPGCKRAYLSFYEAEHLIGIYCGLNYPLILESSTNALVMSFTAEKKDVYHSGFRIHYYAVRESKSTECIQDCPSECTCIKGEDSLIVKGTDLFAIPNPLPKETTAIVLPRNKIFQLKPWDFENLPALQYINLERNKIMRMNNDTFSIDNNGLQTLKLASNLLKKIPSNALEGLVELKLLDLGGNLLNNILPATFRDLRNLEVLNLQTNDLHRLDPDLLIRNKNLQYLYMQDNGLLEIPNGLFRNQTKLRVLYLSNNDMTKITKETFLGLSALEELYLDVNPIHEEGINQETFRHLQKLRYLKLDSFMVCCYAKKTITGLQCESVDDNYLSSCEDMLKNHTLRVFIWILGILACLGNIGVIVYWNRLASIEHGDRGKKSRVQSFLLTNLAVSDLQMGIYLIIIAFHDSIWQDEYFKQDYEWRVSTGCKVSGALSMISSEASVLILTTITADRFNSIVFHIKARRFSMKSARIVCAGIWILALLMGFVPFLFPYIYHNHGSADFFYGRSSVCLPLQLSSARPTGWEYAVFVYIFFNGCAFLFILLAYIAIFIKVKMSSQQVRSNMKKDSSLALRVVLIIVTDFCCWIPVVIIGGLSLANKFQDSSGQAYAWIAVFVLPINSSINPLLYTFSNPQFRKLFNVKKLFNKCSGQNNEQSQKESEHEIANVTGLSAIGITSPVLKSAKVTPLVERKFQAGNPYYSTKL